jgi:hypothetical protein
MTLTIDPESHLLGGYDPRRAFSAAEFAASFSEPPACPVCGTPVSIDRIDVTLNREDEIAHGRSYIPGRWECSRGCNPVTGERYHGGWQIASSTAGWRYTCSCGADIEGTDSAELTRTHQEHGGRT